MTREPLWIAAWRMNRVLPVAVGALLGLNLALFVVALLVVAPRVDRLEQHLAKLQQRYRQARAEAEEPSRRIVSYRRGQEELQIFRQAIPAEEQFTALIEDLFTMAGQAGLQIDRIDYDPQPVEGEQLLSYALQFNVSGDYGQVKKFVFLIEHSPRLVAIEQLSLNRAREAADEQVALRLRLTTYFRRDEP